MRAKGGETIAKDDATPKPSGATPKAHTQHARRKPLGPFPYSEDDLLRKVIQGGPTPEKRQPSKQRSHGDAGNTPKSKPQKDR